MKLLYTVVFSLCAIAPLHAMNTQQASNNSGNQNKKSPQEQVGLSNINVAHLMALRIKLDKERKDLQQYPNPLTSNSSNSKLLKHLDDAIFEIDTLPVYQGNSNVVLPDQKREPSLLPHYNHFVKSGNTQSAHMNTKLLMDNESAEDELRSIVTALIIQEKQQKESLAQLAALHQRYSSLKTKLAFSDARYEHEIGQWLLRLCKDMDESALDLNELMLIIFKRTRMQQEQYAQVLEDLKIVRLNADSSVYDRAHNYVAERTRQ